MEVLRERGVEFDAIEYLKTPLERAELEGLLDRLVDPPAELVRRDKYFAGLGLDAERYSERAAVVELLLEHPKAMQRPVVVRGARALIARPPERLLELLD